LALLYHIGIPSQATSGKKEKIFGIVVSRCGVRTYGLPGGRRQP